MDICVGKLNIIGSDNGLSPGRCHYLNQWWNIVSWNLRNKLQWNLKWNSHIFIQENAFENVWNGGNFISASMCLKTLDTAVSLGLSELVENKIHPMLFIVIILIITEGNQLLNKQANCVSWSPFCKMFILSLSVHMWMSLKFSSHISLSRNVRKSKFTKVLSYY